MGMSDFQSCVMALLMNGANNSKAIFDERKHPLTVYNNVVLSTTQSKFGGSSVYFSSSIDRIIVVPAFDFGTRDFAISLWVWPTNTGANQAFIDARASDTSLPFWLGINSTGLARTYDGVTIRTGGQLTFNAWNHMEYNRASNVNSIYAGGVYGHGWTASQDFGSTKGLTIGSNVLAGAEQTIGYLDEILLFNVAQHTSGFTPPTSSLTIDAANDRASGLILPRHNPDLNGLGIISGTTKLADPGSGMVSLTPNRLVRLFDQKTGKLAAQTYSDASGAWSFTNLNKDRMFFVADFDDSHTFNAVIADYLYPG